MIANPNDGNSPRVEVATPIIDVSAEGLITATTEQEAGYVPGGTKSSTKQLTTQGEKTVTPGTTTQTAVASGRYTTGAVTVKGDANLKAENIAEGVSIFGVTGTHSGGGEYYQGDISGAKVSYTKPDGTVLIEESISSGTIRVLKNTIVVLHAPRRPNAYGYIGGNYTAIMEFSSMGGAPYGAFLPTGNFSMSHS